MNTLSGSVERITYYNEENGYSVIRLRPSGRRHLPTISREGLVTIVGNLPQLSPGEHLKLKGQWVKHAQHGTQFQVETCEQSLPANVAGIRRYLGSSLIRGIGPRLAENIVETFGENTLTVIEEQPERLLDVPNIGTKRAQNITTAPECITFLRAFFEGQFFDKAYLDQTIQDKDLDVTSALKR